MFASAIFVSRRVSSSTQSQRPMVGSYEGNGSTLRKCLLVFVGKDGTPICVVFCSHRAINYNLVEDHRVVLHRAPPFLLSDQLNTREYNTHGLRTQNKAMSLGLKMITVLLREPNDADLLQISRSPPQKHPTGTIYVAWDNASMHEDDEVEAVVRTAAGRLVLLYLPTYSPWLNPIEMLWRHFRREVTHCELFEMKQTLPAAAQDCFGRFNQSPEKILSVIGSKAAEVA